MRWETLSSDNHKVSKISSQIVSGGLLTGIEVKSSNERDGHENQSRTH